MKLSILVPTVPSRLSYFYPRIMTELLRQTEGRDDVEILGLFDNKKRSVGLKRQSMIDIARGEFLVFIDDDDRISENYVKRIMDSLDNNPDTDCVVFECICSVEGGPEKHCTYGIEFDYVDHGRTWFGKPAHTMVWRSSIVKNHVYSDSSFGEDCEWVKRACVDINKQTRIKEVLYYYDANTNTTSETRGLSNEVIMRNVRKLEAETAKPKIKISYVFLIYKSTRWLDFVLDQFLRHTNLDEEIEYFFVANDANDAVLSHLKEKSIPHYVHNNTPEQRKEWYINNVYRAWNFGARKARGETIVFLNSDMAFSPGWDTNLLGKLNPGNCVTSRLVERHDSGQYGIEKVFGNTHSEYDEERFLSFAEEVAEEKTERGGLYMPLAIRKTDMERVGFYPEGNILTGQTSDIFNPVVAKAPTYSGLLCGDKALMAKLRSIGIEHETAFDSIVYHFQQGEMAE